MKLDFGIATRPKVGQKVSGDTYIIKNGGPQTLIAVIDGLGGGEAAADAAQRARDTVDQQPDCPLPQLMQAMHQACMGSRGAVAALLRLDLEANRLNYVGVGNIGVHMISEHAIKPVPKNGIVGYRMPSLMEMQATYQPGDTFILYSDGVSGRFVDQLHALQTLAPQELADKILETHGKTIDDVTVVVARTTSS